MIKGTVLMTKGEKLLLLADNRYFISKGSAKCGDTIDFDPKMALSMPSYMFAVAAMEEENLDETLDFIQDNWFSHR